MRLILATILSIAFTTPAVAGPPAKTFPTSGELRGRLHATMRAVRLSSKMRPATRPGGAPVSLQYRIEGDTLNATLTAYGEVGDKPVVRNMVGTITHRGRVEDKPTITVEFKG